MSERLTASLEDGTLEKLRTLAGGERKVGAYLTGAVSWLWDYREVIGTLPLSDFAPVLQAQLDHAADSLRDELFQLNAQLMELDARLTAQEKARGLDSLPRGAEGETLPQ